ncbi:hypothetical protein B7H01_13890 [Pandoraea apista]|nr:hypothetical protein B7H01_13890 [Pandoraea apista]
MKSKFQTSQTLRQSKICLAVATMLAAMSMPAQAENVIESEAAAWSEEKSNVAKRMSDRLQRLTDEYQEKLEKANSQSSLKTVRLNIYSKTKDIASEIDYKKEMANLSEVADKLIADLKGGGREIEGWLLDLRVADMENVKREIQKVMDAGSDEFERARGQFDVFLKNNAEALKSADEALSVGAKKTALNARFDALNNADEATFKLMANTKELVASSQNGSAAALTWGNNNLFNAHFDEGYPDGASQIGKETVLDITKRSGAVSDAIDGANGHERDVGTIRVAKDVTHLVGVIEGYLNVHQGLEGAGELAVAVGNSGSLNFEKGGKGIDPAARHVVLIAGSGASAEEVVAGAFGTGGKIDEEPGVIRFLAGTSAQNAAIAIATGAQLRFEEGSSAGASTIMVNDGTVHFDDAHAGSASIQNAGRLVVDSSTMGTSSVINGAEGEFTASDTQLEKMHLTNLGTTEFFGAAGGNARISNDGDGHVTIHDTNLENLSIDNANVLEIVNSSAGKATILNAQGAVVMFSDTALESLQLENRGTVIAKGNTTADNARIRMSGGVFDVSNIEGPEGRRHLDGEITIGSLSGHGDLLAEDTHVTLGSLNQDDVFEGRILNSQEVPLDVSTKMRAQLANGDDAQELAEYEGVRLTKVGTGNLTLTAGQSDVSMIAVEAGMLTAAHVNALGAGTVSIAAEGTVALSQDVTGVTELTNAGTLNLGMNKLEVGTYASETGAKIKSRIEKVDGELRGGNIRVSKEGNFEKTELLVSAANDIEIQDIVGNFEVVQAEGDAQVTGGKVTVGSISVDSKPITEDPKPVIDTKITEKNIVKFVAADGGYTANEQAVLASVDGVTVGDLSSGKIGGKVLSAMALQTAGSDEQRKSARMLSGESLVNNAVAAQAAATTFQRGMQTRMIAGGAMFDDKTTNGALAADNGIAGWASFNGGKTSQRGDGMSFDVKGLDGAIGVDKRVNRNTLVGASVGFGNQESKAKGLAGESKVNSVSVGLYGSHLTDTNWFVNGGAWYTNHSVKTDRTVSARNASARLTGKTSGQTFGMFGEVGKRFEVSGMNIDPSVGVRVASTRLNAFDEANRDGSGNDGLKVGSQSQTSTRGVLGVRLWSEVASVAGGKVAPSLRLTYEREFSNTQSSLTSAIYGASNKFTVKGPKLGKDIFTADLGLDMQLKKQLEVRVGGNVSVRKGENALGGGISAKYRF